MERNRFSQWTRQNLLGLVAIFIALSGTAYATHPGGANTVSSGDIIDGAVKSADVGTGEVRSADVLNASLVGGDVANESLTNADILDGTILGGDIRNGTLGTNDYGDRSIVGLDIAGNTIEGGNIASGTVDTTDIADGTLVGLDIAGNTIGGGKIADGTITGADIDEAQVSGLDRCQPGVTVRLGAICFGSDGSARSWSDTTAYCASFGLRLPTLGEAMTLATFNIPGIADDEIFWTDEFSHYEDFGLRFFVVRDGFAFDGQTQDWFADEAETACVTGPVN